MGEVSKVDLDEVFGFGFVNEKALGVAAHNIYIVK